MISYEGKRNDVIIDYVRNVMLRLQQRKLNLKRNHLHFRRFKTFVESTI